MTILHLLVQEPRIKLENRTRRAKRQCNRERYLNLALTRCEGCLRLAPSKLAAFAAKVGELRKVLAAFCRSFQMRANHTPCSLYVTLQHYPVKFYVQAIRSIAVLHSAGKHVPYQNNIIEGFISNASKINAQFHMIITLEECIAPVSFKL